jgi:hypothetical protein
MPFGSLEGETANLSGELANLFGKAHRCQLTYLPATLDGAFYPTRFASPQGALIPLTPQESLVLYRPPGQLH